MHKLAFSGLKMKNWKVVLTNRGSIIYGKREIKVELIPYIAEVLGVTEQELFSFDIEYATSYNYKQSKEVREIVNLLQYAPNSVVEHIKLQLQKYKTLHDESAKGF